MLGLPSQPCSSFFYFLFSSCPDDVLYLALKSLVKINFSQIACFKLAIYYTASILSLNVHYPQYNI